jgi:hypothetical protein
MDMSGVQQIVTRHLSGEVPAQSPGQRDRAALQQMGKTLFAGLIMLAIGMAILAFGKNGSIARTVGVIAVLIAMLITAYAVISPMWKTGSAFKPKSRTTRELDNSSPGFLPEQRDPVPMPSVTEPTTQLLEIENAEQKKTSL